MLAPRLPTRPVYDRTSLFAEVVADEIIELDLAEKADPLAVSSLAIWQVVAIRQFPHFMFHEMPDREEAARELLLAEMRQEVGLVFDGIDALVEMAAGIVVDDPAVVAGRDAIETLLYGLDECTELDALIAENIRARRTSCLELVQCIAYDTIVVLLL